MLSKLEFYRQQRAAEVDPKWMQLLLGALEGHVSSHGLSIVPAPVTGGTLGICFRFEAGGQRRFIKTHRPDLQCRSNLLKEGHLLSRLYGDVIHLQQIDLVVEGRPQHCLEMDELQRLPAGITPEQIRSIIADYSVRLGDLVSASGALQDYGFGDLLREGREALGELASGGFIGSTTRDGVEGHLSTLDRGADNLNLAVCHGDLSPGNIMTDGRAPIVVDWEDAFIGVEGFDYLYWLTFIENRKYLASSAIGCTPNRREVELAILVLVVTLKSALSVRCGSYVKHRVPIEARLKEILDLAR